MKKGFNLTVNSVLKAVKRMKYCLPNSGWTEVNRQTDIKCFNFLTLKSSPSFLQNALFEISRRLKDFGELY